MEGKLAYIETQKEIDILDVFEGDDYKRMPVHVLVKSDNMDVQVAAQVYIWVSEDDYLEEVEWHLDHFENHTSQQWVQDIHEFGSVDRMKEANSPLVNE